MTILRSFRLWCLALVCVGALALFSAPSGATAQNRITHLETLVKCPACEGLSVAQSNATAALAVRNEITRRVHEGQSDSHILTSLESVYGTSILLSPSTSGLGALLWVAPLTALLVLLAIVIRLARRR